MPRRKGREVTQEWRPVNGGGGSERSGRGADERAGGGGSGTARSPGSTGGAGAGGGGSGSSGRSRGRPRGNVNGGGGLGDGGGGGGARANAQGDPPSCSPSHTSVDYYFDSYAHFGIHEEMLKDTVRTETYRDAICGNRFLFEDKVVMDVGCGTGILSMFAARSGARRVYAVDCSDIADTARTIVAANGLADTVEVIKAKVEDVELPEKVDVIVSEWMGYCLYYESMLDTVLAARDRFLAPGGIVLPDRAALVLAGIEDAQYKHEKIEFWSDVYGFDMSCIKGLAMSEPLVDTVDADSVVTKSCIVRHLSIESMSKEETTFTSPFKLEATKNDYVHALVAYFDVSFTHSHKPMGFSTGPRFKPTHWKQAVFYLEDVITICAGETITGTLSCKPNDSNPRDLDISITYSFEGERCKAHRTIHYRMR